MYNRLPDLKNLVHMASFFLVPIILFYIVFAFILSRQVKLLNKSFSSPAAPVLSVVATTHLALAVFVALLALLSW